ncbi:MAG: FHA domain-containing protein [Deltaproteobacteria bacterium]|nr:FHA domain-containing protein [Deltaproteobacteria bacterium]
MVFRLRYLQHDFELTPGRFVIGRSTECQLSLDDPLVSRKHALLVVADSNVEVQDLGSRNGVLVNGTKIEGSTRLADGDMITIGSQEMVLSAHVASSRPAAGFVSPHRLGTETITSMQPVKGDTSPRLGPTEPPETASTSKRDAFRLLGGVADKALALGRAEEAERLLSTLLEHVSATVRGGLEWDPGLVEQAGRYGSKLAIATGKARWVDYVIDLHMNAKKACAAQTIDELHTALRKTKNVNLSALRAYVKMMKELAPTLSPAERFLVQRIEGLERLAGAG